MRDIILNRIKILVIFQKFLKFSDSYIMKINIAYTSTEVVPK